MARTKWKNRTPEDQARIAKQQREMRGRSRGIDIRKKDVDLEHKRMMERAVEIYKGFNIPVSCVNHGFVISERYSVQNRSIMYSTDKRLCIVGKCPLCSREALRYPQGEEIMLVTMVIPNLHEQGRLIDER